MPADSGRLAGVLNTELTEVKLSVAPVDDRRAAAAHRDPRRLRPLDPGARPRGRADFRK
jgi:hypothetical protein